MNTDRDMAEALLLELAAQGGDADGVARCLEMLGCRGDDKCRTCPVAAYLAQHGVREPYVLCTATAVVGEFVAHPSAVRAFISRHDDGAYPHLRT